MSYKDGADLLSVDLGVASFKAGMRLSITSIVVVVMTVYSKSRRSGHFWKRNLRKWMGGI
jgi:hypothetical protein